MKRFSAVLAVVGLMGFGGLAMAAEDSSDRYCRSVEDVLDARPHNTSGVWRPGQFGTEDCLLEWGRQQGIEGLDQDVPLEQRREALGKVYRRIIDTLLPEATTAETAPDVGVSVAVGEPNIVMFAPEGKASDRAGNMARLGHLSPTIRKEGRWGQFMFPTIDQLRNGVLCVTVCVGGDTPEGRSYLTFLSDDGGKHWRHYAMYDRATERPASEVAMRLQDGEELRGPLETDNQEIPVEGLNLKNYDGFYRLGDLPKELQAIPIYSRKPGDETWTQEHAFWDPNLLISAQKGAYRQLPSPIMSHHIVRLRDGSLMTSVFRNPVMADIGPDGKVDREGTNHQIWRSFDRGRMWLHTGTVPRVRWWPFLPEISTVRAHILELPNGTWIAAYRHHGIYYSGGGPLILTKSTDEGKTWSEPKAIRVPGVNPVGLVLENGIAVYAYQRPGVFLTFCGDGQGDRWGNDVTLVRGWRHERDENSCGNCSFLATGPDRFLVAYTKWDIPDPWNQPRQAVLVQEFMVTKRDGS